MRESGFDITAHDERFPEGTPDTVWLPEVGASGQVVLTKDKKIRYTPQELAALRRARVRVFVLVGGNLRSEDMARAFIQARARMDALLAEHGTPFVARVNKEGQITRVQILGS